MSVYARFIDGDRLQVFDSDRTVLAVSDPITDRRLDLAGDTLAGLGYQVIGRALEVGGYQYYQLASLDVCERLARARVELAGESWERMTPAEREYQLTQAGQWLRAAEHCGLLTGDQP